MPNINGIWCVELENPLGEGSTLREITVEYREAYEGNGLTDDQALEQVLAVNTPHGPDDTIAADQKIYLPPAVYNIPGQDES